MPDNIDDDLQEAFRAEAEENLQVLTEGLLALEEAGSEASRNTIETVFRAAHSLKGAARAVANWPLEDAAGAWEILFSAWKREGEVPAAAPFDLLQEMLSLVPPVVDDPAAAEAERLQATLEELKVGGHLPPDTVPAGEADFQSFRASPHAQDQAPAAQPPPPKAEKEALGDRRQPMVRISHERLNELVIRADEALAVKTAARHQASVLHRLSESLERIRAQLHAPHGAPDERPRLETATASLDQFHEELREVVRAAGEHLRSSGRAIDELREKAQAAFMRPASSLLDIFPKTVRDLSRSQGKQVQLVMEGGHLWVDQRILEGLTDPLIHLVRNSVDHGIEPPDERVKAGKAEKGRLSIHLAQPHPGRIELAVQDDGAGLPLEQLREEAVSRELLTRESANEASPEALAALIFESGLSTRREVSSLSGRGLGLAIVREKIERFGGQVSVRSEPGAGTAFLISLPSTMVVFRGLSLKVAARTFLLPAGQVEAAVAFRPDQVVSTQDTPTLRYSGELLPLVDLALLLQLPPRPEPTDDTLRQAIVVRSASERAALIVDEVLREDDFPIRPFTPPLLHLKGALGAAVLPSGELLPVLEVADLLESAFHWVTPAKAAPTPVPRERENDAQKTVLVVDDSITSRALLKNILEPAGYKVVLAVDGQEALSALRMQPVDLVVSDVEMPRMDGFELTGAIRKNPASANLPVVLVTALASDQDRAKGLEAGANHYIVKTDFDQGHLLAAVQRLL